MNWNLYIMFMGIMLIIFLSIILYLEQQSTKRIDKWFKNTQKDGGVFTPPSAALKSR